MGGADPDWAWARTTTSHGHGCSLAWAGNSRDVVLQGLPDRAMAMAAAWPGQATAGTEPNRDGPTWMGPVKNQKARKCPVEGTDRAGYGQLKTVSRQSRRAGFRQSRHRSVLRRPEPD